MIRLVVRPTAILLGLSCLLVIVGFIGLFRGVTLMAPDAKNPDRLFTYDRKRGEMQELEEYNRTSGLRWLQVIRVNGEPSAVIHVVGNKNEDLGNY